MINTSQRKNKNIIDNIFTRYLFSMNASQNVKSKHISIQKNIYCHEKE